MIIIDANVIVKLTLEEQSSKETRNTIEIFLSEGEIIAAPSIAIAEALNTLWKHNILVKDLKESFFPIAIHETLDFWDNVTKIPIETLAYDAINIAKRHRLTVYDSFYVAAARLNKSPLFTFDRQIINNYKELSLKLVKIAQSL